MYFLASATVNLSNHFWSGLLKLMATFSTAVLMMNMSALIRVASTDEPKSLSMTASTPTSSPFSWRMTGIPPPPAASGVFHHIPAIIGLFFFRCWFIHERTNRLGGILESFVIPVNHCLGDHRHSLLVHLAG